MVRPATPGTVVVLAATVVLVIVSVSTPIIKSVTFLTADLSVSVASVSIDGTVNLGTFGWCLNGVGTQAVCQGPQLGYELNSDQVFGNNASFSLPNSLIKWLTYALIIHPIAAGLAAITFISGCVSHCREFSRSRATTWLASLATTFALIAFVFDIVLFSIAKSRINSASNTSVGLQARLGNAVWLTLVGFILLLVSGCFFGFGHCCIKRRPTQSEKDRVRPQMDTSYAMSARKDAEDLEKAEKLRRGGSSGLPAFPEEQEPLTAKPKNEELYAEEIPVSEDIAGVGTGYGRRAGQQSAYPSPSRQRTLPLPPNDQQSRSEYQNSNPYGHAEPFTGMYDTPSRQNSPALDHRSRGRQRSDPSPAFNNTPYTPRRQGSATTGEGTDQARYADLGAAAFPQPDQYGGMANSADGLAQSTANNYPPVPVQDAYQSSNAYPQATTLSSNTGDSFHARAATSRHRQSRSMGAAVYTNHPSYEAYQQPANDQAWPHQYSNAGNYLQPQDYRDTNASPYRQPNSAPLPTSGASPTTEVYEAYYNPSPINTGPPAAIPYVADPEATPSPSYHSAEPYPTYGGNGYR
ncbi:pali-domain-containing protein [Cystobasidium minutum MCA 4210]|uniref:pali-domain-containing protein n=1 Tax=Cystobasidium minutum MCA 4210 TaxID=1397322 RepID=UPI0034CF4BCC|eukprot:jgi/Rhomi1/158825/estExt_Genewise1Plus.C_3_t10003